MEQVKTTTQEMGMEQVLATFTFRGGTVQVQVYFNMGLGRYRFFVPPRKDTVFC
jgi:hypothetical protein